MSAFFLFDSKNFTGTTQTTPIHANPLYVVWSVSKKWVPKRSMIFSISIALLCTLVEKWEIYCRLSGLKHPSHLNTRTCKLLDDRANNILAFLWLGAGGKPLKSRFCYVFCVCRYLESEFEQSERRQRRRSIPFNNFWNSGCSESWQAPTYYF